MNKIKPSVALMSYAQGQDLAGDQLSVPSQKRVESGGFPGAMGFGPEYKAPSSQANLNSKPLNL
jgi:hypothetical protein